MIFLWLIVLYLSALMIFWAMIGYPVFIRVLGKIFKNKRNQRNYDYLPTVTVMVVAHNEEKVIKEKLINLCSLDYPENKIKILVTSDNSTDKTNEIVEKFIKENGNHISLYKVKNRLGKTNAQNEAQKTVSSEILVMTDANAMIEKSAIRELVSCFVSSNIAYVCGVLKYTNSLDSSTANSERTYWDSEVIVREIEGRIQSITAGNGALYACKNDDYYDFPSVRCHDGTMPLYFTLLGKRSINCMEAIAFEKAGEKNSDEFKRKIRMNRGILGVFKNTWCIKNIFKYRWFTFFYFGHRTCRNLLWINHLLLLLSNIFLIYRGDLYLFTLLFQVFFYTISIFQQIYNLNSRIFRLINYYVMTIVAQWFGVYNILAGNVKSTWEKAESTR